MCERRTQSRSKIEVIKQDKPSHCQLIHSLRPMCKLFSKEQKMTTQKFYWDFHIFEVDHWHFVSFHIFCSSVSFAVSCCWCCLVCSAALLWAWIEAHSLHSVSCAFHLILSLYKLNIFISHFSIVCNYSFSFRRWFVGWLVGCVFVAFWCFCCCFVRLLFLF